MKKSVKLLYDVVAVVIDEDISYHTLKVGDLITDGVDKLGRIKEESVNGFVIEPGDIYINFKDCFKVLEKI